MFWLHNSPRGRSKGVGFTDCKNIYALVFALAIVESQRPKKKSEKVYHTTCIEQMSIMRSTKFLNFVIIANGTKAIFWVSC